MKKWVVKLQGRGFRIWFEDGEREAGFFTTRYVEAEDPGAAELAAVECIRNDRELVAITRNPPEESPRLYAVRILEVPNFDGVRPPGAGYTFYRGA